MRIELKKLYRRMKRIYIYALYAAASSIALALAGCVDDDLSIAERVQSDRDDRVIFGASISSAATRSTESETYGMQEGDTLTLSNQVFDMVDPEEKGFPEYAPPVPFFIQQFWHSKATAESSDFSEWTEEIGIYTDWTDVAGRLGFYTKNYNYGNWPDKYPNSYLKDNKELKWHRDQYEAEHVFNAWTADFEMQHPKGRGGVTRWVTMDRDASEKRSSQYGTVRFFHFLRDTNDPKKLKGGEDSLCIGTYNAWGDYDHTRPSLEHFVGLTKMVGSQNAPITYRSNAQNGGGTNVSMLFRHLVCQIRISKIHHTEIQGSEEITTPAAAIIVFPKMRRYARFTTGNTETGEGPHVMYPEEESAHKEQIERDLDAGAYEQLLRRTFSDNEKAEPYAGGEYEAYTRNGGLGLAAYAISYMYLAPFDLATEGEFEVWLMQPKDTEKKTYYEDYEDKDHVVGHYFGNLADLVDKLKEERIAKNRLAPEGKESWLLAGEKLKFNLSLSDGSATGLDMTIDEWNEHGGSTGTGHAGSGDIYTEDDFDKMRDAMSSKRGELPDMYGADQRMEFHNDIECSSHKHSRQTTLHVPKGYTLDGMGNILYVSSKNSPNSPWRQSSDQEENNAGTIVNLFIVSVDEDGNGIYYSYFNSEGKLIGIDEQNKNGEGGPFTSMEDLLNYIDEHNLW